MKWHHALIMNKLYKFTPLEYRRFLRDMLKGSYPNPSNYGEFLADTREDLYLLSKLEIQTILESLEKEI